MKTNIRIRAFVIAALFAVVSFAPTLHALIGETAKMNVPFAFTCGSRNFAPGAYTLDFLNMNTVLIRSGRNAALAMIAPEFSLRPAKSGYAVFRKYGDRYVLEEVWMPGSTVHVSVFEQKWEKHAATELARQGSGPSLVELALLDVSHAAGR